MKRILSIALSLLLVLTALTACGGGGTSDNDAPQDKNQGAGGAPYVEDNVPNVPDDGPEDTADGKDYILENGVLTFREGVKNLRVLSEDKEAVIELTIPNSYDMSLDYSHYHDVAGLPNLQTIHFEGEGPHVILHEMFAGCTSLESVTIPGSVEVIGNRAFMECINLKTVVLEEGVEEICECPFMETAVESLEIPASVIYLQEGTFAWCPQLNTLTFRGDVPDGDNGDFLSAIESWLSEHESGTVCAHQGTLIEEYVLSLGASFVPLEG